MAIHPCCGGIKLQSATKWIAILQIVGLTLGLVAMVFSIGISTFAFFAVDFQPSTDQLVNNETTDGAKSGDIIKRDGEVYINVKLMVKSLLNFGVLVNIFGLFIIVFGLVMAVELLKGAKQRNAWRCNAWLNVQIAQMILSIITTPIILAFDTSSLKLWPILICAPIGWIISLYLLWVVFNFINEIRNESSLPGANVQWTKA